MKTTLVTTTLALLFVTFAGSAAQAQPTAEEVTRACLQRISRITEAGLREMGHECRRTVNLVEELVEQGRIEAAREAAERGALAVTRTARATIGAVNMTARECLQILHRLGADPEFARRIARAAERSERVVRGVRDRCLRAIQAALEG